MVVIIFVIEMFLGECVKWIFLLFLLVDVISFVIINLWIILWIYEVELLICLCKIFVVNGIFGCCVVNNINM